MKTYLNSRARINGTKIGDQFCVYTNDERNSWAVESDREHPRAFPVRVYSDNNNRRFLQESSEIIDVLKATGILQGTHEEPVIRDASPRQWETQPVEEKVQWETTTPDLTQHQRSLDRDKNLSRDPNRDQTQSEFQSREGFSIERK